MGCFMYRNFAAQNSEMAPSYCEFTVIISQGCFEIFCLNENFYRLEFCSRSSCAATAVHVETWPPPVGGASALESAEQFITCWLESHDWRLLIYCDFNSSVVIDSFCYKNICDIGAAVLDCLDSKSDQCDLCSFKAVPVAIKGYYVSYPELCLVRNLVCLGMLRGSKCVVSFFDVWSFLHWNMFHWCFKVKRLIVLKHVYVWCMKPKSGRCPKNKTWNMFTVLFWNGYQWNMFERQTFQWKRFIFKHVYFETFHMKRLVLKRFTWNV